MESPWQPLVSGCGQQLLSKCWIWWEEDDLHLCKKNEGKGKDQVMLYSVMCRKALSLGKEGSTGEEETETSGLGGKN